MASMMLIMVACFSPKLVNSRIKVHNTVNMVGTSLSLDVSEILSIAANKGTSGAQAASIQVFSLMWLRTIVNYEYQSGLSTKEAFDELYQDGGIPRLYSGLPFALIQGPLSRFGDTAANALVLGYLSTNDYGSHLPVFLPTILASLAAAGWRVFLMPVDTIKTCLQVNGNSAFDILRQRIEQEGVYVLYTGGLAASVATFVGHWPWFATYNSLQVAIPQSDILHTFSTFQDIDEKVLDLLRSAGIGLCASVASDTCSNSLRVLKTTRQANSDNMGYIESAKNIISEGGYSALFGRGLRTKLVSNCLQGMLFSVLFKYFQHQQ